MSEVEIPDGWELVKLSEVGKFQGGSGFPLNAQGKTSGIYPFFKVSDFSNDGNERSLSRANHYIDEYDRRRIGARVFPAGTIAFAKIGAAIFLERKRLIEQESCLDNNMAGYILNDSRVSRNLVLANLLQFSLGSLVASTALPAIGSGELNGISFLMPSSANEQQAIAAALSDADGVVAGLERVIAKKRLIKQGAMQDLLTARRRLPGFSGEWEVKRLGDVARFGKGKGLPKSDVLSAGPYECIHYGSLFREQPAVISEVHTFTTRFGGAVLSDAGDVLMPTSDVTPSGLAVASCISKPDVILGGDIMIIKPYAVALNGQFLSSVIRNAKTQIMELVSGTTVFHIYAGDMARFKFAAPSVAEQTAIAAVLLDMDAEIQTLEARLTKARAVKEGMMQNLLTGQVRLV